VTIVRVARSGGSTIVDPIDGADVVGVINQEG
jgi:hypothetical protein